MCVRAREREIVRPGDRSTYIHASDIRCLCSEREESKRVSERVSVCVFMRAREREDEWESERVNKWVNARQGGEESVCGKRYTSSTVLRLRLSPSQSHS